MSIRRNFFNLGVWLKNKIATYFNIPLESERNKLFVQVYSALHAEISYLHLKVYCFLSLRKELGEKTVPFLNEVFAVMEERNYYPAYESSILRMPRRQVVTPSDIPKVEQPRTANERARRPTSDMDLIINQSTSDIEEEEKELVFMQAVKKEEEEEEKPGQPWNQQQQQQQQPQGRADDRGDKQRGRNKRDRSPESSSSSDRSAGYSNKRHREENPRQHEYRSQVYVPSHDLARSGGGGGGGGYEANSRKDYYRHYGGGGRYNAGRNQNRGTGHRGYHHRQETGFASANQGPSHAGFNFSGSQPGTSANVAAISPPKTMKVEYSEYHPQQVSYSGNQMNRSTLYPAYTSDVNMKVSNVRSSTLDAQSNKAKYLTKKPTSSGTQAAYPIKQEEAQPFNAARNSVSPAGSSQNNSDASASRKSSNYDAENEYAAVEMMEDDDEEGAGMSNVGSSELITNKQHHQLFRQHNNTLIVKAIPRAMNTVENVRHYFENYGKLVYLETNFDNCPQSAMVTFEKIEAAKEAMKNMGMHMGIPYIRLYWAKQHEDGQNNPVYDPRMVGRFFQQRAQSRFGGYAPRFGPRNIPAAIQAPRPVGRGMGYRAQYRLPNRSSLTYHASSAPAPAPQSRFNFEGMAPNEIVDMASTQLLSSLETGSEDAELVFAINKVKNHPALLRNPAMKAKLARLNVALGAKRDAVFNSQSLLLKADDSVSAGVARLIANIVNQLDQLVREIDELKPDVKAFIEQNSPPAAPASMDQEMEANIEDENLQDYSESEEEEEEDYYY